MILQPFRVPTCLKWLVPCAVALLVLSPAAQADLLSSTNPVECGDSLSILDSSADESAYDVVGESDFTGSSGAEGQSVTSGSGSRATGLRHAKFAFGSATAGVLAGSGLLLGLQSGSGSALLAKSGSTANVDPPVAPVPEPGTISLMVAGLTGLIGVARRRKAAGGDQDVAQDPQNAA